MGGRRPSPAGGDTERDGRDSTVAALCQFACTCSLTLLQGLKCCCVVIWIRREPGSEMEVSTAGLAAVPPAPAAAGRSCCLGYHSPAVASTVPSPLSRRPSAVCLSPSNLTCWASTLGECCWHHVSGQVEVLTQVLNALVSQEPAAGGLGLGAGGRQEGCVWGEGKTGGC